MEECVAARSARLLQCIDDLLQDVGAVICDLLQDRVGVLLQLGALSLALLQLRFQLQAGRRTSD